MCGWVGGGGGGAHVCVRGYSCGGVRLPLPCTWPAPTAPPLPLPVYLQEYQRLRDASVALIREMGVECGGSNVQMAINPADGAMVIIEMNPRVR